MKTDFCFLRQVHPKFINDGKLSSQAFSPFLKDNGKLSVYDGRLISPEQSFVHYTQCLCLASVGVWGVSVFEVLETGLTHRPDPLPDSPAHALIVFETVTVNERRKMAKKLKIFAEKRGCMYVPET